MRVCHKHSPMGLQYQLRKNFCQPLCQPGIQGMVKAVNCEHGRVSNYFHALTGQSRGVLGGGLKRADCAGNDIPSLQEFLQEIRGYGRHFKLCILLVNKMFIGMKLYYFISCIVFLENLIDYRNDHLSAARRADDN